jgi:hypothetical protein
MLFDKAMSFGIRPGGREHLCMSRSRHGQKIKLREAQRRAAEQALCARLRAHARADAAAPAFIDTYAEFAPFYRARIEAYRRFALRAPELWRCRLRCVRRSAGF